MADQEKVIRGLECCIETNEMCWDNPKCPYNGCQDMARGEGCMSLMMRDALTLLKAKEPMVDGKRQEVISGFTLYCPNCGYANTRWGAISPWENTVFYCGKCERALKWE